MCQSVGHGFAPERLKTLELRVNQTNYGIELLFIGGKHLKLFAGHEVQVQERDDQVRRLSRQPEELPGLQVGQNFKILYP